MDTEQQLDYWRKDSAAAWDKCAELRKALEFYACEENYSGERISTEYVGSDDTPIHEYDEPPVMQDFGERARKALGEQP